MLLPPKSFVADGKSTEGFGSSSDVGSTLSANEVGKEEIVVVAVGVELPVLPLLVTLALSKDAFLSSILGSRCLADLFSSPYRGVGGGILGGDVEVLVGLTVATLLLLSVGLLLDNIEGPRLCLGSLSCGGATKSDPIGPM